MVGITRSIPCSPKPCNYFSEKRSHSSQSRKHNKGLKFIFTLTKCSTCRASSSSVFVIIQSILYTTKCVTYKLLILVWLYNYHIFSPCCFLFCCLPYSTTAQTFSNQYLGSSLTAQEKDSYWASPFGDFAFDSPQFGKGGYLIAIWLNKLPEKTIVWLANGDNRRIKSRACQRWQICTQ